MFDRDSADEDWSDTSRRLNWRNTERELARPWVSPVRRRDERAIGGVYCTVTREQYMAARDGH